MNTHIKTMRELESIDATLHVLKSSKDAIISLMTTEKHNSIVREYADAVVGINNAIDFWENKRWLAEEGVIKMVVFDPDDNKHVFYVDIDTPIEKDLELIAEYFECNAWDVDGEIHIDRTVWF